MFHIVFYWKRFNPDVYPLYRDLYMDAKDKEYTILDRAPVFI